MSSSPAFMSLKYIWGSFNRPSDASSGSGSRIDAWVGLTGKDEGRYSVPDDRLLSEDSCGSDGLRNSFSSSVR